MGPLILALMVVVGAPPTGRVAVRSTDYGAVVAIDRRPAGRIPGDPMAVASGLHLIEILRDGLPVWSRIVFVPPGETVEITPTLPVRAGSALTLGEARRGGPVPATVEPRYRLAGSVAAEVGAVDGAWDLQLAQRWRLEAEDAPVSGLSAVVEVNAVTDLAGDMPGLLDAIEARRDGSVAVEEARVGWRGEQLELGVGRMLAWAPGERLFALDGARIGGRHTRIEWRLMGGRRAAPRGVSPKAWLGGGVVEWAHAGWAAGVRALYSDTLHVGGHLSAEGSLGRVRVRARSAGDELGLIDVRLRADVLDGVWVTTAWRSDVVDAFDAVRFAPRPELLPSRAGFDIRGGLAEGWGPVRLAVSGGWHSASTWDGRGVDRGWADLDLSARSDRGTLVWTSSASWARPEPRFTGVLVTERVASTIGIDRAWGRVRIAADGGLERVRLSRVDTSPRWQPVGSLGAMHMLTDALSVFADGRVSGLHPIPEAVGQTAWTARFGIRLR